MSNITISIYSFSLRDKRTQEVLNLNNQGIFNNLLAQFCNRFEDEYNNNETLEKVFKIEEYRDTNCDTFNTRIFKIKSGKYGISSEIVDTDTGEVAYVRDESEADVMPFYFSMAVPTNDSDTGLIIFENVGIYGIKSIFKDSFKEICFDNEYSFTIRNVLPAEYIERFLDRGILKRIRFIRNNIPLNTAERIGLNLGVNINNRPYEEYIIHRPGNFINNASRQIRQFMNRQIAINDIIHLENFEYNNIKLDFSLGGRSKTLNLSNIENVVVTEDITNDLVLEGGHPTMESIENILIDNSRLYLDSMGLI